MKLDNQVGWDHRLVVRESTAAYATICVDGTVSSMKHRSLEEVKSQQKLMQVLRVKLKLHHVAMD